jgi:hypothetical protein
MEAGRRDLELRPEESQVARWGRTDAEGPRPGLTKVDALIDQLVKEKHSIGRLIYVKN